LYCAGGSRFSDIALNILPRGPELPVSQNAPNLIVDVFVLDHKGVAGVPGEDEIRNGIINFSVK
jgi:hypothetical protein